MENAVYKMLVKDIEKEISTYAKRQLGLIKDKIDKMASEFPVTTEDIMIVLSESEERLQVIYNQTYDENIRRDIEQIHKYMDKYFKSTNYDGDIVNSGRLSNGISINEFEQERYLKEKAMKLKNKTASIMKVIAILAFIGSCVVSIPLFLEFGKLGFTVLISGIVSSLLFYAFGEILQILHDIRRNLYKVNK